MRVSLYGGYGTAFWCIRAFVAVRVNKMSVRAREPDVDSHVVMTSMGERENGPIHRGALDVAPA